MQEKMAELYTQLDDLHTLSVRLEGICERLFEGPERENKQISPGYPHPASEALAARLACAGDMANFTRIQFAEAIHKLDTNV